MAIIKCENCGGNVSDKAKACPHCGKVLNQEVAIVSKPEFDESHEVSQEPNPLRKSDSWLSLRYAMTAMIAIIVLAIAGYHWYVHRNNTTKASYDSIERLTEVAERGDADAQYRLGFCYLCGEGVAQDYSNAVKWIRKAAEKDHSQAQCQLGYLYQNGEGVPQDYDEAVKWYRKAAEKGNVNALHNLAICYQNGYGVPKDSSKAEKLWQIIKEIEEQN